MNTVAARARQGGAKCDFLEGLRTLVEDPDVDYLVFVNSMT